MSVAPDPGRKTSELTARALEAGDKVIVATAAGDNVAATLGDDFEALQTADARTDNPHAVTKAQVGLGNVDNTSDADKPVSTLAQTALDALAATDVTTLASVEALNATNVAAMAALTVADGGTVITQGYYAAGDGGGNVYRYDSGSSATIDGGFVIDGPGSVGRFLAVDQTVANVGQFGATGDGVTDDSASIQAAISSSSQEISFEPSTYRADSALVAADGANIRGNGATIDGTSIPVAQLSSAGVLSASAGSLVSLGGFASNVTRGDAVIELSSPATLKVGDVLRIVDTGTSSYSDYRPYYLKGEFVTVRQDSAGTNVTLVSPAYFDYTASVSVEVHRLDANGFSLSDMAIEAPGLGEVTKTLGLSVENQNGIRLNNVTVSGANNTSIYIAGSLNIRLDSCGAIEDGVDAFGKDYGLSLSGVQDASVIGGNFSAARHGITVGGTSVVNRNILVANATVTTNGTAKALDCHGNAERFRAVGSTVVGGVSIGGNFSEVLSCYLISSPNHSDGSYYQEMTGADHAFVGNTVVTPIEVIDRGAGLYAVLEPQMSSGGLFKVSDNTFIMKGETGGDRVFAAGVTNTGYDAADDAGRVSVIYSGNSVRALASSNGFQVYNATGTAFRDVMVINNNLTNASIGKVWEAVSTGIKYDSAVIIGNNTSYGAGESVYIRAVDSVVVKDNLITGSQWTPVRVLGSGTSTRSALFNIGDNTFKDCVTEFLGTGSENNDRQSSVFVRYGGVVKVSGNVSISRHVRLITGVVPASVPFVVGDVITGSSSSATGEVIGVSATEVIVLSKGAVPFTNGETLSNVAGDTTTLTAAVFTMRNNIAVRDTDTLLHSDNFDNQAPLTDTLNSVTVVNP